jgi:Uma2 family endonuclease
MRQAHHLYSIEEYLTFEEGSNVRHEYIDGQVYAMSGGSANHNRIVKNLSRELDAARVRGCESFFSDLRVKAAGLHTYPDVFVVCGPLVYSRDDPMAVANPIVIAEVLSTSTRDYDRSQKFELYRAITTLRDYLLIDQYTIDIEHRFLADERWESKRYTKRQDVFTLAGIDATLHVGALYELVDFSPPAHDH